MRAKPPATGSDAAAPRPPLGRRVMEVAAVFTRLGFTAFGGPAAHVGMMEDAVVARRRWLDRRHFLDAFSALNFIPGPNSTELAIHLGYVRAGYAGLVTAGVCFVVPAVLIILPIAWAYMRFGATPRANGIMAGINAAVVAIVAAACVRFGRSALRDRFTVAVGAGALALQCLLLRCAWPQPDLTVLAAAALAGAGRLGREKWLAGVGAMPLLAAPAPALGATSGAAAAGTAAGGLLQLAGVFLKIGATLFGSGYVLVSYLQTSVVDRYGWLDRGQLLTAISVGQFTPGPLLTTATFVGYLRGWQRFHTLGGAAAGAVVATAAIFAPAFALVALLGPILPRLRRNPLARAALDAVNAAVVALIAVAALRLGATALAGGGGRAAVAAPVFLLSLLLLLRWNVNATWTILLGAAAGAAGRALGVK